MKKLSTNLVYKIAAFVSFIILIGTLVYLTYNTFILKDQQYQNTEKLLIKESYSLSIRNDKLFPGGEKIIDGHINPNIPVLDSLNSMDSPNLAAFKDSLLSVLVDDLVRSNTMDAVFDSIKNHFQLGSDWEYALIFNSLKINLKDGEKIDLYTAIPTSKKDYATGFKIGGSLEKLRPQNRVAELTVSSTDNYSYQLSFSLFSDRKNRLIDIIKLILPVFILGLLSTITIIIIYLATYKNWIRQKKLADMKSDFVNSITHEFHTPISTILVANKTLKNDPKVNENSFLKPLTEVIERQSIRLQRLFSQVLDITAMSGYDLQKEEVEIETILKDIIFDYNLKIPENEVSIFFDEQVSRHLIQMHPFFFTTMISNLFDNAIKHNDKKDKSIQVQLLDKGKNIQLIISDNGEGISDKEITKIFDKFYRSKKSSNSGLGLGLYYVRQCVQVHGWSIEVDSKKDVGSDFFITIPKN